MSGGVSRAAAAAQARVTAHLLGAGARLDLWSQGFTLLALVGLLWAPLSPLGRGALLVAVLAGVVQRYWALRVEFDRRLFDDWAAAWDEAGSATPEEHMAEFDRALAAGGLRALPEGPPRPLASRIRGAQKLLRWQFLALAVQLGGWAVAAVTGHFSG